MKSDAASQNPNCVRFGTLMSPSAVQRESQRLALSPPLQGPGLALSVPRWLIQEFERPDLEPAVAAHGYVNDEDSQGGRECALLLTLQSRSMQLRLVLAMDSKAVRAHLEDGMRSDCFNLMLHTEHTSQLSVLSIKQQGKRIGQLLQRLPAAPWAMSRGRLARLAIELSGVDVLSSLIGGEPLTQVITVAVTDAGAFTGQGQSALGPLRFEGGLH